LDDPSADGAALLPHAHTLIAVNRIQLVREQRINSGALMSIARAPLDAHE